eukprot:6176360-Pleurochrysis_carterae.AAC.3
MKHHMKANNNSSGLQSKSNASITIPRDDVRFFGKLATFRAGQRPEGAARVSSLRRACRATRKRRAPPSMLSTAMRVLPRRYVAGARRDGAASGRLGSGGGGGGKKKSCLCLLATSEGGKQQWSVDPCVLSIYRSG